MGIEAPVFLVADSRLLKSNYSTLQYLLHHRIHTYSWNVTIYAVHFGWALLQHRVDNQPIVSLSFLMVTVHRAS